MKPDKIKRVKRMQNTVKHVNRRIEIINTWGISDDWWERRTPGMFRKNNLAQCSCPVCSLKYGNKGHIKRSVQEWKFHE
jgi:hypothetical protein